MADYRERIYASYVSRGGDRAAVFDTEAAEQWGRIYDSYLAGWLPGTKSAAILDVACGTGNLLHFLKRRGYTELSGVDTSLEQVNLARQVVPRVEHDDVSRYLHARSAEFDLIVGFNIIEHLKKDEVLDFLDGCLGALRSGGRLILQTPNGESPWGNATRYGDFSHETCFTPSSLQWLLSLCGFAQIENREAGPRPLSIRGSVRYMLWQTISAGLRIWNLAETGSAGGSIYTRVFFATGVKP